MLNHLQPQFRPLKRRRTRTPGVVRQLRHALAVLVALRLAGLGAGGAHIDDLSREPAHNALGDRPGTLWVEACFVFNGITSTYHFSSFPIGKQVDIDGNTIKTFMYVPAHGYANSPQPGTNDATLVIGDGTNYLSGRGRVFENLHEEYRAPFWNPPTPRANAGDITIWSTTTPVPDSWIPHLAPLGTVASQYGDTAFVAGFSRLSTPSTGLLPETGDSYGFYATILSSVPGDTQPGIFTSLQYHTGDSTVSLNGNSNTGGSGSWVFNSQGQWIGAAVAVTGTYTSTSRSTVFANFTSSEFYNQLAPYLGIQVLPGVRITSVIPDGADMLITFRGYGGTNYFAQAASTLVGTNNFVDVSLPLVVPDGGWTTNTLRYVGALTNASGFYRIRLQ